MDSTDHGSTSRAGVARHFRHRQGVRRDHRRPGSHRFDDGQAEPLVFRHVAEAGSARIDRGQVGIVHFAETPHVRERDAARNRCHNRLVVSTHGTCDDQHYIRQRARDETHRGHQTGQILAARAGTYEKHIRPVKTKSSLHRGDGLCRRRPEVRRNTERRDVDPRPRDTVVLRDGVGAMIAAARRAASTENSRVNARSPSPRLTGIVSGVASCTDITTGQPHARGPSDVVA